MERGRYRPHLAPVGWYRCPDCLEATPYHQLPRRTVLHLVGRQPIRPEWTFLGSVSSTISTPPSLSTGDISANAGDRLLVLCLMYEPGGPVSLPSVTWGSNTISQTVAGTITADEALFSARWHDVTANHASPVTATWTSSPSNRLVVVGKFSSLLPIGFNGLSEENFSYPFTYGPDGIGDESDFFVICNCEQGDVLGEEVVWEAGVSVHDRRGTSTLVSTIVSVSSVAGAGFEVDAVSGQVVNHAGSESGFRVAT